MGGYANLPQTDTGLHMRMRTRAFIVADAAAPASRVLFLNADICFGDSAVRRGIVDAVSAAYPGLYSAANIALVGTHQHSGVGGFMEYLLPQLTSLGYVNESASAIIEGSVRAVQRAHASLAPGMPSGCW
jgi:neutral ceramidase